MALFRHLWLALAAAPALLFDAQRRALYHEMRAFCLSLPARMQPPLPDALRSIAPGDSDFPGGISPDTIRNLADLAALLDRRSALGLCLRRSLTRFHFLRRAGLPVRLEFGAKLVGGRPDREVAGHAWLTLNGAPYHESGENWQGFTVMFSFPAATKGCD